MENNQIQLKALYNKVKKALGQENEKVLIIGEYEDTKILGTKRDLIEYFKERTQEMIEAYKNATIENEKYYLEELLDEEVKELEEDLLRQEDNEDILFCDCNVMVAYWYLNTSKEAIKVLKEML